MISLAAGGGQLAPRGVALLGLVLACLAIAAVALLAWWRPRLRTHHGLSIGAGVGAGVIAAALHLLPMVAPPMDDLIAAHSAVEVTGLVESAGIIVQSERSRLWQQAPQHRFQLASSSIDSARQHWSVELPIQVISGTSPPAIGSRIRVAGQLLPGQLPSFAAQLQADGALEVVAAPGAIDSVANALRAGLQRALQGRPTDAASLVAGLAIGQQSDQPAALTEAMRTSGLSHLTAVSGGNLAILIVLVLAAARLCRLRLRMQVLCCLLALAGFVVLVRPQPSVLRAAVMGAVVLVGMLTGGRQRGTGVLAVSIIVLIALAPELASSFAFALSVAATAGLILLAPEVSARLQGRFAWLPPALAEALAITLVAQLVTLPIIVAMGSSVGLAGIPANLLAMPVVPIVTVLGLLTAALGTIAPAMAAVTGMVASWFAAWIASVAYTMATLPLAAVPWPHGLGGAALLVVLLCAISGVRRIVRRVFPHGLPSTARLGLCGLLIVSLLCVLLSGRPRAWPMSGWLLAACDVGQGDALVVRTGEHSAMLVDSGLDARDVDRCLQRLEVRTLDVIVLTHFHADHVGGLEGALRGRAVGAVFSTPTKDPPAEAARVEQLLRARALELQSVRLGDSHEIGSVRWTVLGPVQSIDAGSVPNNASIVLLVQAQGLRILLTGDIEPEAQAALMAQWPAMHADIAKIPHHGSRYQDSVLARWSGARVALVSVGEGNDYGHPASSTIQQWTDAGASVWRTDLRGSIAIVPVPDGTLGVVTERG